MQSGCYPECGGGRPIQQRRFLEPRLPVQPGRDPVARARHLAPHGSVARLVRPQESDCAQPPKIQQQEGNNEPASRQVFSIMRMRELRRAANIVNARTAWGVGMKIVTFLLLSFSLLAQTNANSNGA